MMKLLAFNVRKHRLACGLSREALCEKASLSLDTLMRIETAKTNPGIDLVFRIARALGINPAELFIPPEKKRSVH